MKIRISEMLDCSTEILTKETQTVKCDQESIKQRVFLKLQEGTRQKDKGKSAVREKEIVDNQ